MHPGAKAIRTQLYPLTRAIGANETPEKLAVYWASPTASAARINPTSWSRGDASATPFAACAVRAPPLRGRGRHAPAAA
eukprot:scaffold12959_cov28-Tisochrysis_lutea.AAC.2